MKTRATKFFLIPLFIFLLLLLCSCSRKPNDNAPLTEQSLQNLIAFTKLYGYVRYFHPSTEAQQIDWDKFAIYGTEKVERAKNSDELIDKLKELFLPIAPSLVIYDKNHYRAEELKIYAPENPQKLKEVFWKHCGFSEARNIPTTYTPTYYKCVAENKPDSIFKSLPLEDKVYRTEISNNLSIIMPVVLYSDSIGTLPRGDINKVAGFLIRDSAAKEPSKEISRYIRFAGISVEWNIFQHFYPYREKMEGGWQTELETAFRNASTDTSGIDFLQTLEKFTSNINDGHGKVIYYFNKDSNIYYAPLRWEVIENQLVITNTINEATDKLKPGDIILEIDGMPAMQKLAAFDSLVPGATTEWKRIDDPNLWLTKKGSLDMMLSGNRNSQIKLKVKHINNTIDEISLTRNIDYYLVESRPPHFYEIKPGIYYLDLPWITSYDFKSYQELLHKARGIIFDQRGFFRNVSTVEVLSEISRDTLTSAYRSYSELILLPDWEKVDSVILPGFNIPAGNSYLKANKVFIINARAISMAESFMQIVKYYKLATIIGEHTAGTSGVMSGFELPGGYWIYYTGQNYENYDSSRFMGVGVIPDIQCSKTIKGVSEGRDEQLEKAIEVIEKRIK